MSPRERAGAPFSPLDKARNDVRVRLAILALEPETPDVVAVAMARTCLAQAEVWLALDGGAERFAAAARLLRTAAEAEAREAAAAAKADAT